MISRSPTIGQILDARTAHDSDDSRLSASQVREIYLHDTVSSLIDHLRTARVIECAPNHHDDPASGVRWQSCRFREINAVCGHPDRVRDERARAYIKTIGSAIVAACYVLLERGDTRGSIFLTQAHSLFSRLNRLDSAAQIAFVQLRGMSYRLEESTMRDAALQHPVAQSASLEELMAQYGSAQHNAGDPMLQLRDEVVEALLETEAACATIEA